MKIRIIQMLNECRHDNIIVFLLLGQRVLSDSINNTTPQQPPTFIESIPVVHEVSSGKLMLTNNASMFMTEILLL